MEDTPLPVRLRAVTDHAHRRLEGELDLLRPPLSQARFACLLGRFWGFHRVWETEMERQAGLAGLMAGRYRLDRIALDLTALGMTAQAIAALPVCAEAEALTRSPAHALGSLYVLEGSTLGGRIIDRALGEADWAPAGGLGYFSAHGARTGVMWRQVQAALSAVPDEGSRRAVEQGALETFELLRTWLVGRGSAGMDRRATPAQAPSGEADIGPRT